MSQVTASLVKELRDRTGLGMMECKRALTEAGADIDKAIEELRKSSGMKAAKKAGRTAADGIVLIKSEGGYAMIMEVNSETDFAARDEGFLGFANNVLDAGFSAKETDITAIMAGDLTNAREALVQKIGENISARRAASLEAPVIGGYVHSNNRIAVLVGMTISDFFEGASEETTTASSIITSFAFAGCFLTALEAVLGVVTVLSKLSDSCLIGCFILFCFVSIDHPCIALDMSSFYKWDNLQPSLWDYQR